MESHIIDFCAVRRGKCKKAMYKKSIKNLAISLFLVGAAIFSQINASASYMPEKLVPGGQAIGISIETQGVVVVGVAEKDKNGEKSPAGSCGISAGDIITKIGSKDICCGDDLKKTVSEFDGSAVSVQVLRNDKEMQFTLVPRETADGKYELGLWMRDGMAGIGTVTFYDPQTGYYGALGHPVSDVDTGIIMPVRRGDIMCADITNVIKSTVGEPGQLQGTLDPEKIIGSVTKNTDNGIFGYADLDKMTNAMQAIPVAGEKDIKTGPATILSSINGQEVCEYEIEIARVYSGDVREGHMMICITDERLLNTTGGIVQGMSGSPILQNGKLIGAVTHVLINDPARGYAVTIKNMVESVETLWDIAS